MKISEASEKLIENTREMKCINGNIEIKKNE